MESSVLVKDAIVAMAGDTSFSVRPDHPKLPLADRHRELTRAAGRGRPGS
ncbi:hypothetical protein [Streptomyces sp. R35]|uniref:Uncharacterized protein n=1 Tax=Streptomyces sp. R35 TaxID=3238630 RepID=A0AB39SHB2_9ACTN